MHIHDFHFATIQLLQNYTLRYCDVAAQPDGTASDGTTTRSKRETDYEQQHHAETKRDVCGHEPHGEHTPHQLKRNLPKKPDKCIEVGYN
jgi:hypothetical protein